MKEKYKDQDEEEKELMLEILAVSCKVSSYFSSILMAFADGMWLQANYLTGGKIKLFIVYCMEISPKKMEILSETLENPWIFRIQENTGKAENFPGFPTNFCSCYTRKAGKPWER